MTLQKKKEILQILQIQGNFEPDQHYQIIQNLPKISLTHHI
jgi:hypothetical protein